MATIAMLPMIAPLINSAHGVVYHLDGSAFPIFLAVAFDYLALAVFLGAVLRWSERFAGLRWLVWSVLIAVIPLFLLKILGSLTTDVAPRPVYMMTAVLPLLFVVTLGIFWSRGGKRVFDLVQDLFASVFGVAALFGVLLIVELAWFGWEARDLNSPRELHRQVATDAAGSHHGRVIWILLDELSYQQVYGQRYPGLKLPAFDRLASEGTVFSNVMPIAEDTATVIPSLMTGIWANGLGISGDGQLRQLHDSTTGTWQNFDAHQTVFQDALNQGYSTGIAGWYNPYCRILPSVLDRCAWSSNMPLHGHMYGNQSAIQNITGPWSSVVTLAKRQLLGQAITLNPDIDRTEAHIVDYKQMVAYGDDLLKDSSIDFIYLHMPFPHPGGIYDRKEKKLTSSHSSYLDNLALADAYMAHVQALLDQRGEWDSSTVVVMGDHSWRTTIVWRGMPEWTPEDELASHGGKFDDRPGYIVKLPGQHVGATIDTRYKAIRTRGLLDELLSGQVKSAEELQAWVRSGGG